MSWSFRSQGSSRPEAAEEEGFTRPSTSEIASAWRYLFADPLLSASSLKGKAVARHGLGEAGEDGGVLLRSVYWRFYHDLLPPPGSPDLFAPHLESTRSVYSNLRRRYLVAPDGHWAADCSNEQDDPSPHAGPSSPRTSAEGGGSGWDPLSLDGDSPWKTWFAHEELRSTIRQDVDRTFPDISYFRLERVKRSMTSALFLWSVLNPDVGYRQGMHELFAVCLLAVDRDSLDSADRGRTSQDAMLSTLDRRYVEHDAFELYQALMRSAKPFYEWRAEEGPRASVNTAPPAPIIARCKHLQSSLIRHIDPQLWERLDTEGVEAQLWAIRWIRLLFTREVPFGLAMRLWDGIFALDTTLALLDYICVAMLLLIRNELIEADYGTLLTSLLRYPAPSETYPFDPHLIISQALYLRDNTNPAAGVQVVLQNQDILGVQAQPSGPKESSSPSLSLRGEGAFARGPNGPGRSRGGPPRTGAATPRSGMQGLAAGLFERAQAAGLDKAIMSTVADFRKNLPDSATAYSYLPNLPFSPGAGQTSARDTGGFSSIPSSASALPQRSFFSPPPPPPGPKASLSRPAVDRRPSADSTVSIKSMKDAEREIAELRLAMMGMGRAMNDWLLAITQPEYSDLEKQLAERGLERLRDTLLDAAGRDTDEIVKEWAWHEGLEAPRSRSETPGVPQSAPPYATTHTSQPKGQRPPPFAAGQDKPAPSQPSDVLTPTNPSFDAFPTTPKASSFPSAISPAPEPRAPTLPPPQPVRPQPVATTGQPIPGLTRIPLSPASPATAARSPCVLASNGAAARIPVAEAEPASIGQQGDPLAGLGVSVSPSTVLHSKTGHGAVARSENIDPLRS